MNFQELFRIICEDAESQEKQALNILKKQKITNPEDIISQLKQLTEPYKTDKGARNNGHLPDLTKLYISSNYNLPLLSTEYNNYMSNTKLKSKPLSRFNGNFLTFIGEIHAENTKEGIYKGKDVNESESVYSDENVMIFLADTPEKAVKYGKGTKYGLCISRPLEGDPEYDPDSENMFYHYRHTMSTYFVYFKNINPEKHPKSGFIIVDKLNVNKLRPDYPDYSLNIVTDKKGKIINRDIKTNTEKLIELFPELIKPINQDVFKFIPMTTEEKYIENWFDGEVWLSSPLNMLEFLFEKYPVAFIKKIISGLNNYPEHQIDQPKKEFIKKIKEQYPLEMFLLCHSDISIDVLKKQYNDNKTKFRNLISEIDSLSSEQIQKMKTADDNIIIDLFSAISEKNFFFKQHLIQIYKDLDEHIIKEINKYVEEDPESSSDIISEFLNDLRWGIIKNKPTEKMYRTCIEYPKRFFSLYWIVSSVITEKEDYMILVPFFVIDTMVKKEEEWFDHEMEDMYSYHIEEEEEEEKRLRITIEVIKKYWQKRKSKSQEDINRLSNTFPKTESFKSFFNYIYK